MPDSKAKTAMLTGIASLPLTFVGSCLGPLWLLAIAAAIVGIVFGFQALGAIKAGEAPEDGKTGAMVGIATGGLGCLMQLGVIVLAVVAGFFFGVLGNL